MNYDDLPPHIKVNLDWFDKQEERWQGVADAMSSTYTSISGQPAIPPYSDRIPANMQSFRSSVEAALASYLAALQNGSSCAANVAKTMDEAAVQYTINEGYSEETAREIDKELD